MKLKVTVQPKHVKKGICGNTRKCAIALALSDMGFKYPEVGSYGVNFFTSQKYNYDNSLTLSLPKKAESFIHTFDAIKTGSHSTFMILPKAEQTKRRKALAAKLTKKPLTFSLDIASKEELKPFLTKAAAKKL